MRYFIINGGREERIKFAFRNGFEIANGINDNQQCVVKDILVVMTCSNPGFNSADGKTHWRRVTTK